MRRALQRMLNPQSWRDALMVAGMFMLPGLTALAVVYGLYS